MKEFIYLGTTLTSHNCIQEEIKIRLNSGNACYQSVQNILCSIVLSKNTKIKIYRTIILHVVLYGYEAWSLTLMEEHRLRVNMCWYQSITQQYLKRCLIKDEVNYMFRPNMAIIRFSTESMVVVLYRIGMGMSRW